MRVLMQPHLRAFHKDESGIKRVVEAYFQYLPQYGVELVDEKEDYDLLAVHAGSVDTCDVAHLHGVYWTADYPAETWEWAINQRVVNSMRTAKEIIVPSEWVAETIRRDLRRQPHVLSHGIDWDVWQHKEPLGDYVLWNKNRSGDVCDPSPMETLARRFPKGHFVTTFATEMKPDNVNEIGLVPHEAMMQLVQSSLVYLATVKETFGIGILEAMAAGVPVLGYGHGGILDLVEHGVNGYLARPGNLEDLEQGLQYCIGHRDVLGANGREMARRFTWEKVVEQLAGIYQGAMKTERARVDVVIPAYNYAHTIERAVRSVLGQTFADFEVFVVDDGSQDNIKEEVPDDPRVHFITQSNAGVAVARNNGISKGTAPFVCCLDADDAMEPELLETCVNALVKDNSLGIAHTGLRWIKPDGTEGVSPWPTEWNYDKQLQRQNQIPTCCVFRRDMWASLGGYRSRYCPSGAGSEDADFWTRCGAYGWRAEKVTGRPLFIYSWMSGLVSGDPNYSEIDWLSWHPWAEDKLHPIGSYAKPKRFSHPARQYDEPIVSVIIPVGPGHDDSVINALDSLDAQTLRKWESIVVWDAPPIPDHLVKAFPHVRWYNTDKKGPGAARNLGAKHARADLLLFLDADDWLHPEALEKMVLAWEGNRACIYTDYLGKAFIDNVDDLAPATRKNIINRNDDGETIIRYEALPYDWQRAQRQPEYPIYIWCNITTLTPKIWHDEIGGFDETMKSWEDWDYWCRMARAGKPFVRIPEPLLVYLFYSGGRRDTGEKAHKELLAYLEEKYKGVETVACTGCGKSRVARSPVRTVGRVPANDGDFVLVRYTHPNKGNHMVYGPPVHQEKLKGPNNIQINMARDGRTQLYRIGYGYRAGGDVFLAHTSDIAVSHLFEEIEVMQEPVADPPPMPIPLAEPEPLAFSVANPLIESLMESDSIVEPSYVEIDLQKFPGITPGIAIQLEADGIDSKEKLAALGTNGLQAYRGVGQVKAERILGALAAL